MPTEINGETQNTTSSEVEIPIEEVDMVYSELMGEDIREDSAIYVERYDDYVTQTHINNNMYVCPHCDRLTASDDWYSADDCCDNCVDDEDDFYNDYSTRTANLKTTQFQSKTEGSFIKSQRKFGVEIECGFQSQSSLKNVVVNSERDFGFVHDGSLNCDNAIEVVTPILQGKKGEQALIKTLKLMTDNGVYVDNSCGLHVHLDGSDLISNQNYEVETYKELKAKTNSKVSEFNNRQGIIVEEGIMDFLTSQEYGIKKFNSLEKSSKDRIISDNISFLREKFDTSTVTKYMGHWLYFVDVYDNKWYKYVTVLTKEESKLHEKALAKRFTELVTQRNSIGSPLNMEQSIGIERKPKDSDVTILDNGFSNIKSIRNIMAFYHVFSDVFLSMLPLSRRTNHYCKKLSDKFTLKQLREAGSLDSLLKLWYETTNVSHIKSSRMKDKYDDSRYYGVNFHSLFKSGTVEIRYHSGTTNKNKILFWIHLHQAIIDLIVADKIFMEDIQDADSLIGVNAKLKRMFALLKLPKKLESYIKTRISYLNNVPKSSLKSTDPVQDDDETMD